MRVSANGLSMKIQVITKDLIAQHNLTDEEHQKIDDGREIFLSMLDALKKAKLQPRMAGAG
jgi:hypothetical protein